MNEYLWGKVLLDKIPVTELVGVLILIFLLTRFKLNINFEIGSRGKKKDEKPN